MPSILYEDDFVDFTIIELPKQYWRVTYIYENDPDSIYYFYLPNYKKWYLKYLQKKWLKSLTPLKFVLKKIERLDSNFNPHLQYDNEQCFETLLKFKEVIAKRQKRRKKVYLRKQSSEQL